MLEPVTRPSPYGIVALASSAGGIQALAVVLAALPDDFPVPVVVVQHLDPHHESVVAHILRRRTGLDVTQAHTGLMPRAGHVYIAPPNCHLLIDDRGRLKLGHGERVHFLRPSADVLFSSAAEHVRSPVIGVVLSGTGVDGAAGARVIRQFGGVVIAQDEASSAFFGMPRAAIAAGAVDQVLPLDAIAARLVELVSGAAA